jgi:F-type H+-transporting ATPase subunit b
MWWQRQEDSVQIDYFTLFAQIINFLVLVLLLRHFLYGRIIKVMDEREKRIESQLQEAEKKKKEAEDEADSYRKMKKDFLNEREGMLIAAREETQNIRRDLSKKAADEVNENKAKWNEEIQRQKVAFLNNMRRSASKEIYAITRRALADLANEELESHIMETFIHKLQKMDDDEQKKMMEFLEKKQDIVIKSGFMISESMRQSIQKTLKDKIGDDLNISYLLSPDPISGIELSASDLRISWSIGSYLDSLEDELSRMLVQIPPEDIKTKREGYGD